jgi:hypothetical protein
MTFNAFQEVMTDMQNFRSLVYRSVAAFTVQLSHTVASNALHSVEERLARWLADV